MTLQRIKYQNISDIVYSSLREAIFSRNFAPGQRLNVNELQQQLGVSRTPLKDALNRLAAEGLIKIVPRRGTFVTELRADEMAEVCDVRAVLELHAVEHGLPRITSELLQRMREHVAAIRELITPQGTCVDHMAFVAHDHGFHQVIIEAAGNRKLSELYEALNVHIHIARVYYLDTAKRARQVCAEHEAILRAYEAGDLAAAKEAVAAHLASTKQATLERLQ